MRMDRHELRKFHSKISGVIMGNVSSSANPPVSAMSEGKLNISGLPDSTKVFKTSVAESAVKDLTFTDAELAIIRDAFKDQMHRGWSSGQGIGASSELSSLKMISSHINILPNGDEKGVFFAVDLGGTNLRVLRVTLSDGKSSVREFREAIPSRVTSPNASASTLFDFIADACAQLCIDILPDSPPMPLGFTFSFPCSQTSIRSGRLLEWTKGFETSGCVGEDPVALLQASLDKKKVPLSVDAICNDTVGTLMTNAYTKRSKYCRIGVILGTGTNAAYSDPDLGNLIINIEWGGFNKLPRRTKWDIQVDEESPNKGKQFLEKMVSGLYLGEIFRLAAIDTLGNKLTAADKFHQPHAIETADISNLLMYGPSHSELFASLDTPTVEGLVKIADAVIERSAAVAAVALAAVVAKATAGEPTRRCEVGIDGSVYTKCHKYKERLMKHLNQHLPGGEEEIVLDFSEDGSGLGAALVAAAISRGRQISDM